jgi:hypothetical protein
MGSKNVLCGENIKKYLNIGCVLGIFWKRVCYDLETI